MNHLWKTADIATRADVTLVHWRVMETERSGRHFVGICRREQLARVSDSIKIFDPARRIGVTRAGVVYKLFGYSGFDLSVDHAWGDWRVEHRVSAYADVTNAMAAKGLAKHVRPPSAKRH